MISKFHRTIKGIFSIDYELVEKLFRWPVILGIPFEIIFQIVEEKDGYYTPWSLRIAAIAILIFASFFPKKFTPFFRISFEVGIWYVLGFHMCFIFLMNTHDTYAGLSWVICGFLYGFLTQPILILPHWAGSIIAASILAHFLHPQEPAAISTIAKYHIATLWVMVTACGMRLVLQNFMRVARDLEGAKRANEILQWRNDTISIFIRPSILKEIEAGKNPIEFQPTLQEKTIMVCDLRNFSVFQKRKIFDYYILIIKEMKTTNELKYMINSLIARLI